MNWIPIGIMVFVSIFGLGLTCAKHGEEKTRTENFWITVIAQALHWGLLYWAFFI